MINQFLTFIEKHKLFQPKDKILLAVSGGIDSIVMTELFQRAGFNYAIAHCNFQLRGKDSDEDEKFVHALAKKLRVQFFSKQFDTKKFSKENKFSIQQAARKLRYDWFEEIRQKNDCSFIATAHHLNDSIETFFINLFRGTGISGLTGINPSTEDEIIRPLLFATRNEIESFAKKNKIKHRLDRSNDSDDYLRNKIRHHLIPVLKKLSPSIDKTMARTFHNLLFADYVFNKAIITEAVHLTHEENGMPYFSRKELMRLGSPVDYLYEFLSPFDFNATQVEEIWDCKQSGKVFFANGFRVTCDRDKIIFGLKQKQDDSIHLIKKNQKSFRQNNFSLTFKTILLKKGKKFSPPPDSSISCLDVSLLEFPLSIRTWKPGDSFYPLGMKHRKKLSDFFTDHKFSLPEKENAYVLLSGNHIVCILGHRIDDRYKVTAQTKKVLRINYLSTHK